MYGELKLSEKLVKELDVIRNHVDTVNEKLEEALYTADVYKSEVKQIHSKYLMEIKEVEKHRKIIMKL